jgi:hypothetical protein
MNFAILGSWSIKICHGFIICNGIEDFPTILKHVIVLRVMTFMKKKFGKYEVCDGLHNSLLIMCNHFFFKFKVHHISKKDVFCDQC